MPDGNIEFLGRLDHQVKIRGFRIELGEIESVISGHHEIKEAVVLAREDTPGDKRLVAYIVPTVSTPDLEDLRQLLRSQLAEYMVPASFVVLDSFPLTSNGKIDRKALPAPTAERAGEISLPESEAERRVASIWSSILDLEEVGTRDTFFSLGGHSLLVMRLANQLAAAFDREVAVADIFRFPTVEHQARFLTEVPPPDEALAGLDAATQRQRNARKQQRRRAQLRRPSE
jgi:acyl carrier protein